MVIFTRKQEESEDCCGIWDAEGAIRSYVENSVLVEAEFEVIDKEREIAEKDKAMKELKAQQSNPMERFIYIFTLALAETVYVFLMNIC